MSSSFYHGSPRIEDERHINSSIRCQCGMLAKSMTSWTQSNPGRRFYTCHNSLDKIRRCGFFRWIDPELPNKRYKAIMYDLHMRLKSIEK
ncbi:unnamed protein product [Lactuca virosa]|uniref:GRF-type domain-containing protein n=1 Tax=Lactuca virosa TaxID=75947 RepID=A0AAU9PTQ0_9ASTR|nr:unnamed protein product [Lactuca virosa]